MSQALAAIFRLQLFKPSETFIKAQADQLRRHRPVYVGRRLFGDPLDAPVLLPRFSANPVTRALETLDTVCLRNCAGWERAAREQGLKPCILHAHFAIDAVYALPLARAWRIPLVTTLHGFDVTRHAASLMMSGRPALINGLLHRKQLQQEGVVFLCVSEAIRQAALDAGFPADKLRVHYIGIDTATIRPRDNSGEDGLILHVARLVEKKGTALLLAAFAQIVPTRPQTRLVIIGDGPLRGDLEKQAIELGIAKQVQFLGMLPNAEVLAWDRRAAMKAVPSITAKDGDQEGFGIVNLEAAALGVPVVGFASGGIAEAVVHEKTGLLAPEGDVDGLAQHLATLLDNPNLRHKLGTAARHRAVSDFDIAKQTGFLEDIYEEVRSAELSTSYARRLP